ncbi:MAG: NADH-quinone oxidoreductase subunit N [Acidimicrobiia bacterium]|nr:NADH-quinone oxidoreductase subunit N [Acidimicrobiia bacterium]
MITPEIHWMAIAPELVLSIGAALVLLVEVQWKPATRVLGTVAGAALAIAAALTYLQWLSASDAVAVGDLSRLSAFRGMVLMDGFAIFGRAALLVATALGAAAGWEFFRRLGRRGAEALALVLLATAGFSTMVASNNLVMLFLGLEVGSISLYVLTGMTRENQKSDEAAIKYFLMGSFASAIFVYGIALAYAGTRQLTVTGIASFLDDFIVNSPAVILIGIGLMVVGLGFKVSAAPFHNWSPDVYQGAPAGIVGYMAAVAKIAGFIAIARILLTAVDEFEPAFSPVVAAIAVVSMLLGSVMALVQSDIRRMLAYSGVAHAGFIMTGVVGGGSDGVLFYLAVYSVQLVGAFAVVAAVSGSSSAGSDLDRYRGLARGSPAMAASFAFLLLGMAGLPVTSGFIAKFGVFSDAWAAGFEWLVVVAVAASVVALAFYLRVIVIMYMEDDESEVVVVPRSVRWVLGVAVGATLLWGVLPAWLLDIAADALPL